MVGLGHVIVAFLLAMMVTFLLFLESIIFLVRHDGNQFSINWLRVPLFLIAFWVLFVIVWYTVDNFGPVVSSIF